MKLKRDPDCTDCRLYETAEYVCLLGTGPTTADVMIVGEAPGHREDDSGTPFVGKAGQLLRKTLREVGLDDDEIFITNAVSCRPPDNRTPTRAEIKACSKWLEYQIESVKPMFVLLLGNTALQSALGQKGITKLRGRPIKQEGITYLPAFHPAAILRDPGKQEAFEADIRMFRDLVQGREKKVKGFNPVAVDTIDQFEAMLNDLEGTVSFDIETNGLYPWAEGATITAIGFGTKTTQWSLPLDHPTHRPWKKHKWRKQLVRRIGRKLKDCKLVAHNGKFDCLWMLVHYGVRWPLDFDTMLAHYILDENTRHGLKHLSTVYYGAENYDLDPTKAPWEEMYIYHCWDLYYTRRLRFTLGRKLKQDPAVQGIFRLLVMPCSEMFLDAEYNGVHIDMDSFEGADEYLTERIATAKASLIKCGEDLGYDWSGVNWRSPKQLAKILFEDLDVTVLNRSKDDFTKTGNPSTNESVLKRVDHPIAGPLLDLRGANQQFSFFIKGWRPYLDGDLLHPSFKIHGAVTGRPSCEHPNLQQVPRDSRIRSLVTAPDGWQQVEADLSQVELRIAAELSGDERMLETFMTGKDIHWQTAIREIARHGDMPELVMSTAKTITGEELDYSSSIQVLIDRGHKAAMKADSKWKEIRKKAKAINFGFLYGMWHKKFKIYARDNYGIEVTEQQAKESRAAYFDLYRGLLPWHRRQIKFVREHGYVTTLTGRKRRLPAALAKRDSWERKQAERQAINSPVQGFAAEWNLMAAVQLRDEYSRREVKIVGTVHDAILFRVRDEMTEEVVRRLLKIMERPAILDKLDVKLRVPILAEASIGPWSKGKELDEWLASR